MLLLLNVQMVAAIMAGTKIHTMVDVPTAAEIVEDEPEIEIAVNDGLLVPDVVKKTACLFVQEVDIKYWELLPDQVICPDIIVDGRALNDAEKLHFVRNAGFAGFADFMEVYPEDGTYGLIHWTGLKY
jgi:hypothetical protein